MELYTKRLILRHFKKDDLDDLFEIFSDKQVMEHVEPPYSKDATKSFLNDFCIRRDPKPAYAAVHKESGKLIGYLLFKKQDEPEIFEIGWIFNKQFWRQGYSYEAANRLIKHGFEDLKLHKICAQATDQVASVAVMKKLGMTHEGTFKKHNKEGEKWLDLYHYAILESDTNYK